MVLPLPIIGSDEGFERSVPFYLSSWLQIFLQHPKRLRVIGRRASSSVMFSLSRKDLAELITKYDDISFSKVKVI